MSESQKEVVEKREALRRFVAQEASLRSMSFGSVTEPCYREGEAFGDPDWTGHVHTARALTKCLQETYVFCLFNFIAHGTVQFESHSSRPSDVNDITTTEEHLEAWSAVLALAKLK